MPATHLTYTPVVLPLIASAAIALGLGVYTLLGRRIAGAGTVGLIMLGVVVWSLCYAFVLAGDDGGTKPFWYQAEYLGVVTIPTGWLIFSLRYTRAQPWLGRQVL